MTCQSTGDLVFENVLMSAKQLKASFLVTSVNSPRNSASSGMKPRIARVPSAKLRSSVSMDFSSLQGMKGLRNFSKRDFVVVVVVVVLVYLADFVLFVFLYSKDCLRETTCHRRWVLLGRESLIPME